jgi:hypothetical protein
MSQRPIIQPAPWPSGKSRSMGGAFDELYRERAPVCEAKPKKRSTTLSRHAKVLRDLDNSAPAFNTPLPTQASRDRSHAIKRSPSTC